MTSKIINQYAIMIALLLATSVILSGPVSSYGDENYPWCPATGFWDDCQSERIVGENKKIGIFKNNQLWTGKIINLAEDETRFICEEGNCRAVHSFRTVKSPSFFDKETIRKSPTEHWMVGGDSLGSKEGLIFYQWPDGSYFYGFFQNDERNGFGNFYDSNGDKFSGNWKNGLKHGFGKYTEKDGSFHLGYYDREAKNGLGIKIGADGRVIEAGLWERDKFKQASDVDVATLLRNNSVFEAMSLERDKIASEKLAYLNEWRDATGGLSFIQRFIGEPILLASFAILMVIAMFMLPKEIKNRLKGSKNYNLDSVKIWQKPSCKWEKLDAKELNSRQSTWRCKTCKTTAYTFSGKPPEICKNPAKTA